MGTLGKGVRRGEVSDVAKGLLQTTSNYKLKIG